MNPFPLAGEGPLDRLAQDEYLPEPLTGREGLSMVHRADSIRMRPRPPGRGRSIRLTGITAVCLTGIFLFVCLMIPVSPVVAVEYIAARLFT